MAQPSQKISYVAYCNGRACPKCRKCRDWYCRPPKYTKLNKYHLGPLIGPHYGWYRRSDAACGYHAYPHYVHNAAYHGHCRDFQCVHGHLRITERDSDGHLVYLDGYSNFAVHGPNMCHCDMRDARSKIES